MHSHSENFLTCILRLLASEISHIFSFWQKSGGFIDPVKDKVKPLIKIESFGYFFYYQPDYRVHHDLQKFVS